MWHTWVGRANGRNCFHPSVGIHHKRKSRVVSLWSPSCHSQRKSQRPNSSRPYGSEFSPFFTDKWLLFLHTTPIQPNPHQWAVVFFFPHRTRSCSAPLKELGLSSFLPPFFSWGTVLGASRSVSPWVVSCSTPCGSKGMQESPGNACFLMVCLRFVQ
jgi:hypothetical protein